MVDGAEITMQPLDHVRGSSTLFIDGVAHRGSYDAAALLKALPARE